MSLEEFIAKYGTEGAAHIVRTLGAYAGANAQTIADELARDLIALSTR